MATGFLLPPEVADRIEYILAQLHDKTQASCTLLADITGQLISEQGRAEDLDPAILAALTASNMGATAEMARQIGEKKHFKLLFHEGERQNVYLSNVGDRFLLVVIFDTTVQLGLVRLFTKQAINQLLPLAKEFETLQARASEAIDTSFGDALIAEMENIFGDWGQP